MLRWIHPHASPERDRAAEWITDLGTWLGVVPITVALVLYLLARRRSAQGLFVLLSMVGAWVLNDAAKAFYGRERPALWNSATREMWFGFPSGHAMSSMALGTVLTILAWRTPARWLVLAGVRAARPRGERVPPVPRGALPLRRGGRLARLAGLGRGPAPGPPA